MSCPLQIFSFVVTLPIIFKTTNLVTKTWVLSKSLTQTVRGFGCLVLISFSLPTLCFWGQVLWKFKHIVKMKGGAVEKSAFELNPKLRDSFENLWFLSDVIFKLAISSQILIFQGSKRMSKLSFPKKKGWIMKLGTRLDARLPVLTAAHYKRTLLPAQPQS